jgi:curved DNA-binding protein CbpA
MNDYYKILGITYSADFTTIKKAYRQLALQFHPDKNKSAYAAQNFIAITEAYEVLRDDKKRANYDFLYKKYFQDGEVATLKEPRYQGYQQAWTDFGEQRAKEYSSMKYDDFAQRILDEIKIGARYIPNLMLILFLGVGLIGVIGILPKAFSDSSAPAGTGVFLIFTIIVIGILGYFFFKRTQDDYLEERKRNFKQ